MIDCIVSITENILTIVCNIMVSCFAIVLSFVIVVMVVCLVWWILDEMQRG